MELSSLEMLTEPTFPKLSSAKLTLNVPSDSFSILNLVPLIPIVIPGVLTSIDPP